MQVLNDDIIVSLPGSHYSVTYYKPARSPQLVAKFISDRDDPRVAMSLLEFLVLAWRLANDKARELGWGWACEASLVPGTLPGAGVSLNHGLDSIIAVNLATLSVSCFPTKAPQSPVCPLAKVEVAPTTQCS